MLPLSGGCVLNAYGATNELRPISSQIAPYSRLVNPGPKRSSGRKRFQRPSALARLRISRITAGNGVSRSTSRSSAAYASSSTG